MDIFSVIHLYSSCVVYSWDGVITSLFLIKSTFPRVFWQVLDQKLACHVNYVLQLEQVQIMLKIFFVNNNIFWSLLVLYLMIMELHVQRKSKNISTIRIRFRLRFSSFFPHFSTILRSIANNLKCDKCQTLYKIF